MTMTRILIISCALLAAPQPARAQGDARELAAEVERRYARLTSLMEQLLDAVEQLNETGRLERAIERSRELRVAGRMTTIKGLLESRSLRKALEEEKALEVDLGRILRILRGEDDSQKLREVQDRINETREASRRLEDIRKDERENLELTRKLGRKNEQKSGEQKPGEQKPGEPKDGDPKSGDPKSDERKPGDEEKSPEEKREDEEKGLERKLGKKDDERDEAEKEARREELARKIRKAKEETEQLRRMLDRAQAARRSQKSSRSQESREQPKSSPQNSPTSPQGEQPESSEKDEADRLEKKSEKERERLEREEREKQRDEETLDALRRAERKLDEASKRLEAENDEGSERDQEDALAQLNKAKENLQEQLDELEDLKREDLLKRVIKRLTRMQGEQQVINIETGEVAEATREARKLLSGKTTTGDQPAAESDEASERLLDRARSIGTRQRELQTDTEEILEIFSDDGSSVIAPSILERVADDMENSSRRLAEGDTGSLTQLLQRDVSSGIEELLVALDEEKAKHDERMKNRPRGPSGQPEGNEGGEQADEQGGGAPPGGGNQPKPLFNPVKELKLLLAIQRRLRQRTEELDRLGLLPDASTGRDGAPRPAVGDADATNVAKTSARDESGDDALKLEQAARVADAQRALAEHLVELVEKYPIIDRYLLGANNDEEGEPEEGSDPENGEDDPDDEESDSEPAEIGDEAAGPDDRRNPAPDRRLKKRDF